MATRSPLIHHRACAGEQTPRDSNLSLSACRPHIAATQAPEKRNAHVHRRSTFDPVGVGIGHVLHRGWLYSHPARRSRRHVPGPVSPRPTRLTFSGGFVHLLERETWRTCLRHGAECANPRFVLSCFPDTKLVQWRTDPTRESRHARFLGTGNCRHDHFPQHRNRSSADARCPWRAASGSNWPRPIDPWGHHARAHGRRYIAVAGGQHTRGFGAGWPRLASTANGRPTCPGS